MQGFEGAAVEKGKGFKVKQVTKILFPNERKTMNNTPSYDEALTRELESLRQEFQELNMLNFSEDEVSDLNSWAVQVVDILTDNDVRVIRRWGEYEGEFSADETYDNHFFKPDPDNRDFCIKCHRHLVDSSHVRSMKERNE